MKSKEGETIKYYNDHAADYYDSTVDADMSEARDRFIAVLPKDGHVLDFGCGSGRDAKAFMSQGFRVDAFDGSEMLCRKAEKLLGKTVRCMDFRQFEESETYDGIWACASILHLSKLDLADVIKRIIKALKPGGVSYVSFKYGEYEGIRNDRYFTDLSEKTLQELLPPEAEVIDEWTSADVRPGRQQETWLNAIVRRKS